MNSDLVQPVTGRFAGAKILLRMPDWLVAIFLITSTFLAYLPAWRGLPIWDERPLGSRQLLVGPGRSAEPRRTELPLGSRQLPPLALRLD